MKVLFAAAAAAIMLTPAQAEVINARTVNEFIEHCATGGSGANVDACGSYLVGAMDQVALAGANTKCGEQLSRKEALPELWLYLAKARKEGQGQVPLNAGVRAWLFLVAPSCG